MKKISLCNILSVVTFVYKFHTQNWMFLMGHWCTEKCSYMLCEKVHTKLVRFSLGAQFMRPCATSKQKA